MMLKNLKPKTRQIHETVFCSRIRHKGEHLIYTGHVAHHNERTGRISVRIDRILPGHHFSPHDFAYELWVGELPEGNRARSNCGFDLCCRTDHLELVLAKPARTPEPTPEPDSGPPRPKRRTRLLDTERGSIVYWGCLNPPRGMTEAQTVQWLAESFQVSQSLVKHIIREARTGPR